MLFTNVSTTILRYSRPFLHLSGEGGGEIIVSLLQHIETNAFSRLQLIRKNTKKRGFDRSVSRMFRTTTDVPFLNFVAVDDESTGRYWKIFEITQRLLLLEWRVPRLSRIFRPELQHFLYLKYLLIIFYPVISYGRVQMRKKGNYSILSLVTVRATSCQRKGDYYPCTMKYLFILLRRKWFVKVPLIVQNFYIYTSSCIIMHYARVITKIRYKPRF